jgi:hypothetical protein
MALLRMFYRAAFICNLCFLLAIGFLWFKHPIEKEFASLIIVMGFFLSVILNVVINGWMLVLFITKKKPKGIPKPLIYLNGGFLALQLILLLR